MRPLEDRIHDELAAVADGYRPSAGLADRIEATRQRARNRSRALLAAIAASALVVSAIVVLADGNPGPTTVVATPSAPSSVTTTPPSQFLATVGPNYDRAAVVDTASGHIVRTIATASAGQLLSQPFWVISPDGRTLYAATLEGDGCTRRYVAIDIATGAIVGSPYVGLSDLAPSPDGQSLAYTTCHPPPDTLAYVRRSAGGFITIGGRGAASDLTWSGDSSELAYYVIGPGNASDVQVVPLGHTSAPPLVLHAADPGCFLNHPVFAGTGLYAVERCPAPGVKGPVTLDLVLLDPTTGARLRSWPLAAAPSTNISIDDLAIDPTGAWALYSLSTPSVKGQVSLLSLAATTATPKILLSGAYQVAWLPDTVPGTETTASTTPRPLIYPSTTTTTLRVSGTVGTTIPLATVTTAPPSGTATTGTLPPCSEGAPTTPYFLYGCVLPNGSIQPPP